MFFAKKIKIGLLICLFQFSASAQSNFLSLVDIHNIKNDNFGNIEVGVFKAKNIRDKPLVLFLGGSSLEPVFRYSLADKQVFSPYWGFAKYKEDYHIAYINIAGLPLYDTVPDNRTMYKVDSTAYKYNTLDWRAESASFAIDHLIKKLKPTKVYVIGHSQGGQVVPKIAVLNKKVDKIVVMSANALDHIYDLILITRQKAINNFMSQEEAQYVVDSLFNVQKQIYLDPKSLKKSFWGGTYNKWYSYSKTTPLDNMLLLNIPILLIASGRDVDGSYIANTDYAMLEFIRKGKNNLTYKVYPNFDHIYVEVIRKFGNDTGYEFKMDEVIKDIFSWLNK
ncbi:hypothetical protein [Flavobacterium sp.]|uniref:hypothetical protein n=1 Tax=Flavobacterium sp. TaxID=239 RepID=UPI002FD93D0C